jgi:hypothetical protein
MLSNSASKLKMEWMMKSKNEKIHLIGFVIIEVILATMIVLIDNGILGTNPDYTLEDAARSNACICLCLVMFSMFMMMSIALNEDRRTERKKKGLRPEWTNQDLDLLDEDIEELYERVKALESRRY